MTTTALKSPNFNIISQRWFTGMHGSLGAVLTITEHAGFKSYIGISIGLDETLDAVDIALHGAKLDYEAAYGLFSDEMIAHVYAATEGMPFQIKYDGILYKSLYKKTQSR